MPGPPAAGDEAATLLGGLERLRACFAWKVAGLDASGLTAKVGASGLTLGGLIKHLAFVEDLKLSTMLLGQDLAPPCGLVPAAAHPPIMPLTTRAGAAPPLRWAA